MKKPSFTKEEILKVADGILPGIKGKLPTPPMLMIDRILKISSEGGKYGKGLISAELDINPKNWFFECHFKGDPVMPGCLGLDGFWQLLGFFLSWIGGDGYGRALGVQDLKFKGMVYPHHEKISYKIDIKKLITRPVHMAWADAELKVKDHIIYFAKNIQVGLFHDITNSFDSEPAPYTI